MIELDWVLHLSLGGPITKTSKWFGWPYGFQSPGLVFIAFA